MTLFGYTAIVVGVGFFCFTYVILFGAPFLPTLKAQVEPALDLLNLKPGQTMLELGCGDGRVMLAAAKRGWIVVGYELNPILVLMAKFRLRKYRSTTEVHLANFWTKKLPPAQGIFTFLLVPYMKKLHNKIVLESKKPLRLVSFAFQIQDKTPAKTHNGLYLYIYE